MRLFQELRRTILFGVAMGTALIVQAADYEMRSNYRSVLDAHHIKVSGSGRVEIPFNDAVHLLQRPDLLDVVQASYARILPEGQTPEFVIQPEGHGRWSFVNRHNQTSVIEEIHRKIEPDGRAHVVYYSEGRRFFGDYRSVVDIAVSAELDEGSRYEVIVYAYPLNSVSRFFARHLGVVERFFRDKTKEITSISVSICRDLANPEISVTDTASLLPKPQRL